MDLRLLRSTLAAAALFGAGIVQAALPTYSASTLSFLPQAEDSRFQLSFFAMSPNVSDNDYVLTRRTNGTTNLADFEIYSMSNLLVPVQTIVNPSDHPVAGTGLLLGEYVYIERFRYISGAYTDLGDVRCRYTTDDCSDPFSANWQPLDGALGGYGNTYAQLSSNASLSGIAVYQTHDMTNYNHYLMRPDGSAFIFATHPQIYSSLSRSYAAGYVDGFFTVLVWDGTTSSAYVFETLDLAGMHVFPLGGLAYTEALSMNAAGRTVFYTRNSLSDTSGMLSFCDLSISSSGGTPTGVTCNKTDLGTGSPVLTTVTDTNDVITVEYSLAGTGELWLYDTDEPTAPRVTASSLTLGAVTGSLVGFASPDGRIIAVPPANIMDAIIYDYTLLTPSGGNPVGGNALRVLPQPSVVNPGDSRDVVISLEVDVEDIYAIEYHCQADPSILSFISGDYVSAPNLVTIPLAYDSLSGMLDGALGFTAPAGPMTGSGVVSVLNYVANADYGTTSVTCEVLGSDINGNPLTFDVQNATVTINDGVHMTGGTTVSGVVTLPVGSDFSGTTVTLTINGNTISTVTDVNGFYSFVDVQDGPVSVAFDAPTFVAQCLGTTLGGGASGSLPTAHMVAGDINNDDVIDIADFTMMAGHFGARAGQPRYLAAADLNADGRINVQDLAILGSHFGMTNCNIVP